MISRNPFLISGYVSPEYFCDREEETKTLIGNIKNGRNTAILSRRRMGKTGLIKHCFQNNKIKKEYYTFFIDIYATSSLRELVFALSKEIFERLKPKGTKFLEQFFSVIGSLRAGFKLDQYSGEPTLDIGLGDIQEAKSTLDEIFLYLEKANKPCLVAIDEFQQIANYKEANVEAVLRTLMQQTKNCFFIFAGSQHHIMTNLFQSPSRPFYQSVVMMHLDSIPQKNYTKFVLEHFNSNNRQIENELISTVYKKFEGHTWYLQMVFNELFSDTAEGENCDVTMLERTITKILSAQAFTYQEILARLPEKQKEILIAISREGKAKGVTSGDFVRKYKLQTPSSVQAALKYLTEKDLVMQENNVVEVYDRFFGIWLQRNF
jgi:AAA+ ATPase superfamily predicted ATPase